MPLIKPTVGRKVWYWPSHFDKQGPGAMCSVHGQPLDATVLAVWSDRCVNLLVVDISGKTFGKASATLIQGDDLHPKQGSPDNEGNPTPGGYAQWMPYQLGQAYKVETSAKDLAAAVNKLEGAPALNTEDPDHGEEEAPAAA